MIIQFSVDTVDGCNECGKSQSGGKQRDKELHEFTRKFETLRGELRENTQTVSVDQRTAYTRLNALIPCVGCRKSVEKLYARLMCNGAPALSPLCVTPSSELTLCADVGQSCERLFELFHRHGRFEEAIESIPKSKKNRCLFHSLENHKTKQLG